MVTVYMPLPFMLRDSISQKKDGILAFWLVIIDLYDLIH